MAKIVNLVIVLALFLCWLQSLAIDTEDVSKMADQFSALTSSTWDVISKLKFVSRHAVTFVRVTGPVGALIAAGADIAYRPTSEELKAIEKLHQFVKAKFDALSRHVQHQTTEIKHFLVQDAYSEKVTEPLNVIERFYSAITDPFKSRTEYKSEFIALCTGYASSPHNALLRMKLRLVTNCPMPSLTETELYATVLALFKQIEKRHLQHLSIPREEYEFMKSSLLAKSTWEYVARQLKTIVHTANSTKSVEQALITLHSYLDGAQDMCWLTTTAEGNAWKRKPLLHFAELARLDLMKASLIASHCANISYAGSPQRIEEELSQIELLLKEISAHMADWITAKLTITWPTISSSHAKAAIGDLPIVESDSVYATVALDIKQVLDQMGEEKYFHTVIVFPNWKDERQVASICPVQYCFNLTDVNDVNVFVVRYQDDQYERAVRASAWFTPTRKIKMIKTIIKWWEANNTEPLIGLAQRMQEEVHGLAYPELYSHLVLLRTWKFFRAAATITLGLTPTNIRSVGTEKGFNYVINPPFIDAETFHVHMLL